MLRFNKSSENGPSQIWKRAQMWPTKMFFMNPTRPGGSKVLL